MTEETILRIISDMNGDKKNVYTLNAITANVDYAIFTTIIDPNPVYQRQGGPTHAFYLIKNKKEIYIGAVYEMWTDLHWVVAPKYRRKGILLQPMREVIIPELFKNRSKITISISHELEDAFFEASEKLALKIGFAKYEEDSEEVRYKLER